MEMLTIEALRDPVVEALGHPVSSRYVEVFWLPILGPSAVWLLRHASYHTSAGPYVVEAEVLGKCLGLGHNGGKNSALARTVDRVVRYDCGSGADGRYALRTHLDRLPYRYVQRLPGVLQEAHHSVLAA